MRYVLDACAMIALLKDEEGADVVGDILDTPGVMCYAHRANLYEVHYEFARGSSEQVADNALEDIKKLDVIERDDFDVEFMKEVSRHKAALKHVSLADCFAIVLANRVGGTVLTSDFHEFEAVQASNTCKVHFIRTPAPKPPKPDGLFDMTVKLDAATTAYIKSKALGRKVKPGVVAAELLVEHITTTSKTP
jgi:PIN domain nuclease of toxin-antitoxin system